MAKLDELKYANVLADLGRAGVKKLDEAAKSRGISMREYVEKLQEKKEEQECRGVQGMLSRAIWIDLRTCTEVPVPPTN